jgi:hypothetical protein
VFSYLDSAKLLRNYISSDSLSFMLRRLCTCKFTSSLDKIKDFVIEGDANQIL